MLSLLLYIYDYVYTASNSDSRWVLSEHAENVNTNWARWKGKQLCLDKGRNSQEERGKKDNMYYLVLKLAD